MSQRTLFRDLQCRNNFVCQSCLSTLAKPVPVTWQTRQNSSQAAQRHRTQTQGRRNPRASARTPAQNPFSLPIGNNGQAGHSGGAAAAALLRQLLNKEKETTMRFFDKDEKGAITELPNDDAFSDALNGKGELEKEFKLDLASDMRQLLGALKQDGSLKKLGIDDPDAVAKDLEDQLGNLDDPEGLGERFDEYIKELEDKLEAQGLRMDRLTNMDDDDFENDFEFLDQPIAKPKTRRPVPQIPTEMWTYNQRRRLSRLNAILERVDKQLRLREAITAKTVQSVWKAYNLARQTLAKGWANVPQEVWDLLWAILSVEEAVNPSRFAFLSLLARDMSEAKVALNPSQQLITMEALFVDGFEAKAIDNWKRCMSTARRQREADGQEEVGDAAVVVGGQGVLDDIAIGGAEAGYRAGDEAGVDQTLSEGPVAREAEELWRRGHGDGRLRRRQAGVARGSRLKGSL
ncbi:conserved hypothetical protein [Verticillium alfalfae VaMs.102]|uniref:Uncharacterized protein n=1 Tax=Verticillium alfalfae (strain VaMs.102 / ATCC MYA-4576 / FGSC 10136) TaxID=526221 RepID=C9SHV3_VERA1|nr:conserved hypothetical protein [Verticillium alfalfae VaMs.102]EEY18526.1 conserved hypothetical protein [Verticillium alfalfae VaMs.102]